MARRGPSLPLMLSAAFTLLLALLLFGVLPSPVAVAEVECSGEYAPPNVSYNDCKKTQTAEVASPAPPSNTPGSGGGGGSQPVANTSTPTITRTATATPSAGPVTPTLLAPTTTPTVPRESGQNAPTPTLTSLLPEGVEVRACIPGTVVPLLGMAPPGTPLLAFFDERPVGGGFSRDDGIFSIDLLIGDERPGLYLVEVRERASNDPVLQLGCEVPALTPTPTLDPAP